MDSHFYLLKTPEVWNKSIVCIMNINNPQILLTAEEQFVCIAVWIINLIRLRIFLHHVTNPDIIFAFLQHHNFLIPASARAFNAFIDSSYILLPKQCLQTYNIFSSPTTLICFYLLNKLFISASFQFLFRFLSITNRWCKLFLPMLPELFPKILPSPSNMTYLLFCFHFSSIRLPHKTGSIQYHHNSYTHFALVMLQSSWSVTLYASYCSLFSYYIYPHGLSYYTHWLSAI